MMLELPTLFLSHGAPTYALNPGVAGQQLTQLGRRLPRPRAILVLSPHWMTTELTVSTAPKSQTIHDFGGFDPRLYSLRYDAPGAPSVASQVAQLLVASGIAAREDSRRGLDHGAWVPLRFLYPRADVPVFQLSLPVDSNAQSIYELGRALRPIAKSGVLVIGSGSLTHNLYEFRVAASSDAQYAKEFATWIRDAVLAGDVDCLLNALAVAPHASRAHPTSEHFLPFLFALGAASNVLPATVLRGGIAHGVLSMESYLFGAEIAVDHAHNVAVVEPSAT
jgi:4,5-DOPA dioxygenase extradiol